MVTTHRFSCNVSVIYAAMQAAYVKLQVLVNSFQIFLPSSRACDQAVAALGAGSPPLQILFAKYALLRILSGSKQLSANR